MSSVRALRRISVGLIVLCSAFLSAYAQSPAYKNWINEDVRWIISNQERADFEALRTDQQRNQFVETFWLRRDPTPDTAENEFKEEHYGGWLLPINISPKEWPDGKLTGGTSISCMGPPIKLTPLQSLIKHHTRMDL